jgi:PAS domain S-box-containing protein
LVNPRYQQLFPTRTVLGRPVREAMPELEGQQYYELLDQVYQTGEPFYGREMPAEVDYAGAGRMEQRYFDVFFQALRDAQGRIDGLLNFAYDVTEQVLARREAEQLNQELEARVFKRTQALRHAQAEAVAAAQGLRHVTNSLPSTSFAVTQRGEVLYVSPQWYAYTGMAIESSINEVWPTLIHPDDLPAVAREFGAALAEGRPWSYEFRLRGADGAYRWFASQGMPEPPEEAAAAGRSRQWFGSNLDIDDLQQARREREAQRQQLHDLFMQAPAAICILDGPDLVFELVNPQYQAMFGGRDLLGKSLLAGLPELASHQAYRTLRRVLDTGALMRSSASSCPSPGPVTARWRSATSTTFSRPAAMPRGSPTAYWSSPSK